MRIICIDDEPLILNMTVELCEKLPQKPEVKGFTKAGEALLWLEDHAADIALLDINMPDMSGLRLAAKIREIDQNTAIIFLTGYSEYALDAFKLHASGYLMKPMNKDRLAEEIEHAAKLHGEHAEKKAPEGSRITAHTFGEFDLFVDGKPVSFPRSKSKELLAYLIDRQGGGISRATAAAVLWEDSFYDRSIQKQLDVIIRSLRSTLESVGAQDIFEMGGGTVRIVPEKIDCDLYRFLSGDAGAVNSYRGEYMNAYAWADMTEAFLTHTQNKMK